MSTEDTTVYDDHRILYLHVGRVWLASVEDPRYWNNFSEPVITHDCFLMDYNWFLALEPAKLAQLSLWDFDLDHERDTIAPRPLSSLARMAPGRILAEEHKGQPLTLIPDPDKLAFNADREALTPDEFMAKWGVSIDAS